MRTIQRLFATPIVLNAFFTIAVCAQLKVKEDHGHIAPVRAKITLRNDRTREVVINGVGGGDNALSHVMIVWTEAGVSKRTIWIDSIASISGLDNIRRATDEFTVHLKNASEVSAMFSGGGIYGAQCSEGQRPDNVDNLCSILFIGNADEGTEKLNMRDLKSVEFLPAGRKDKLGNAMFDTWKFSPFTGERLPSPAN